MSKGEPINDVNVREAAERICDCLFTSGFKETGDRLEIKIKLPGGGERAGGGWCRSAVRDVIVRELSALGQGGAAVEGAGDEMTKLEQARQILTG